MLVSHEWLRQFVPHTHSAEEIGELLSRHCVTLDRIERLGADLGAFVVARVAEASRHPNSDHLWVTKVDDGSGTLLDVVCGAPNVTVGTMYPFARTGTTMPGGLTIEKRKIRGETSNGMLCSARELGLGEEHDGILALDTEAAPGTPLAQVLPAGDSQLDLDVLPNRPDLLSHQGVAREISALTATPLIVPSELGAITIGGARRVSGREDAEDGGVYVRVEDSASCPAYIAIVLRGVTVGPSPQWLQERLASVGVRSISNIVDATNYMLHGFGQPVHAFDLARLAGTSVHVRPTDAGESIVTLDGVTRPLAAGTTVICDGERPIALAGIMGGRDSEVTASTTSVLLEVATFDARFVRSVRKAVGIVTDASYRYERGTDAGALTTMAELAASLILSVAGGKAESMMSVGAPVTPHAPVMVRPARVSHLLGVPVTDEVIERRLASLGAKVTRTDDNLSVIAPSWRHDLLLEVDYIEEVARLGGFDVLPNELRAFRPATSSDHPLRSAGKRVRDALVTLGASEARPMPFTATGSDGTPRVRNPLAEHEPFLRASLLQTLATRAEYNLSRMQGNVRLFELGDVFLPSASRLPNEELHVAALIMGQRRPPHFTEPQPPMFDAWDARYFAEQMAAALWPGCAVQLAAGEDEVIWTVAVDDVGVIGEVRRMALDAPVWAAEAFGIELRVGLLSSADVAPNGQHAYSDDASVSRGTARGADDEVSIVRRARYRPLPGTPAAEFDLSLLVPEGVAAGQVTDAIRGAGGELLERADLFDEFRGNGVPTGFRSLAWRLTFRHPERTLRDKEIEGRRARLLAVLAADLGIKPRAT